MIERRTIQSTCRAITLLSADTWTRPGGHPATLCRSSLGLDDGHAGQMMLDEITGGSPYGATTIAGGDRSHAIRAARSRQPQTSRS
jgi:hypothetical protein